MEEVPQRRVQPLSLLDAFLGHSPRLPQNHPNPGASPGPGASCPRNEAREPQGTSARSKPAAAVLRAGPQDNSAAGNSPRGGAPLAATPQSQCSRLGVPQGGRGRKGRRVAGAAQARYGSARFSLDTPTPRSHWPVRTPAPSRPRLRPQRIRSRKSWSQKQPDSGSQALAAGNRAAGFLLLAAPQGLRSVKEKPGSHRAE